MKMETLKTNYCKNGNTNDQRLLCRILLVHSDTLHIKYWFQFSSIQFSCSFVSDSLQPHEPQNTIHHQHSCPSPAPGVYPNSRPLSWQCHPTTSSSVIPFSSYLQSFPATGSFPMSQLFTSSGQSIGVSASTSVLPMNTQD